LPGIATIIDYSGDTVMAEAPIGPGPSTLSIDSNSTYGYTFNSDGTLTNFLAGTNLQAKLVQYTTLPTGAVPLGILSPVSGLWAPDLNGNQIDVFGGYPESLKLQIPVAATPVMVMGTGSVGLDNYAISQSTLGSSTVIDANGIDCNNAPSAVSQSGTVTPIEVGSLTSDAAIPVGKCPVYALLGSDNRRVFVLNRGDDTISVINAQSNLLDACTPFQNQSNQTVTCHPTLPLSTTALAATGITPPNCNLTTDATCGGMTKVAGPVYAEYNAANNLLVVSNYDGSTVSIIDVSLDEYGNDSSTFGTTYTVAVGKNPASVTVLYDGSRAYTANQTDGTVSIVNLTSHTIEKPALTVVGHPRTVVSTQNSEYGKVYVASPDSPYLTILSTTTDLVDTTILVEGNIVDVRVTTTNGSSAGPNNTSRKPGFGQPCNLPGATTSLTACTQQP
jgi:DNA-binding beta-propeller fold protein YncE